MGDASTTGSHCPFGAPQPRIVLSTSRKYLLSQVRPCKVPLLGPFTCLVVPLDEACKVSALSGHSLTVCYPLRTANAWVNCLAYLIPETAAVPRTSWPFSTHVSLPQVAAASNIQIWQAVQAH